MKFVNTRKHNLEVNLTWFQYLFDLKLRCDIRPWFEPTNVISLKTQLHAVNACVERSSQRSFRISKESWRVISFIELFFISGY